MQQPGRSLRCGSGGSAARVVLLAALASAACSSGAGTRAGASSDEGFQREFGLEARSLATTGRNPYCVLEPGYRLVLKGGGDTLTITVLDETRVVDGVTTRVVEEREEEDGELVEVSRNYLAICPATLDVFYFGEDVDVYEHGKLAGHPGVWHAGEGGARPGLFAPGTPRAGAKYCQEIAPGVAMDRAEVVDLDAVLETPAGRFEHCLKTHETTGLAPRESEYKLYAPGIGLIQDEDLKLSSYGRTGG
jgi:hypothetical protein